MLDYRASFRLVPMLAVALIVLPLAAPGRAAGDVSETRNVAGFDRIRVEGAFTTVVRVGGNGTRVVVTGSQDTVGRVTTEVNGGTLLVGMRSGGNFFSQSPKLEISLPRLRSFANAGTGSANITGLSGGRIEIRNDGAASIVASGRASREDISLAGTGKIDATAVDAHDVTVDNDGVGSVSVRASGSLTMNVNGVGSIRYAGNPSKVQSQVNGVGSIGRI